MLKLDSPSDRRLVSPVVKTSFKDGFDAIQQSLRGFDAKPRVCMALARPAPSTVIVTSG